MIWLRNKKVNFLFCSHNSHNLRILNFNLSKVVLGVFDAKYRNCIQPLDKNSHLKSIFLISQPNYML